MTVTIQPKNELPKTDDNDNETCYTVKNAGQRDHTDSLLENYKLNNNDSSIEKIQEDPKIDYLKYRRLYRYDEAPEFLKHNSYILSGYRGVLDIKLCVESIFWWTNETINIWSHIMGFMVFFGLTVYDLTLLKMYASFGDKLIVMLLLFCCQVCMILSAIYHTFSCKSEETMNYLLSYDLCGIALSLLSIYISGIYFAFWCDQGYRNFYMITVSLIFVFALMLHVPKFNFSATFQRSVFVAWAIYGVIPTFHWSYVMGGFEHPMVALLIPRVFGMYLISGSAFLIYLAKIPERWCAGKVDYLGHSHQWWHVMVVAALCYWHNTGMMYVEYRLNHACSNNMRLP